MIAVILGVRLSLFRQFKRWSSPYLLLAFFFLIGGLHGTIGSRPPNSPNHIRQLISQRQEVSVTGTLLQSPELSPEKTTLLIDSDQIIDPPNIYPAFGLVRIAVNGRVDSTIQPGDHVICRAWLSPVSTYGVPGAFDYKKFMAQKSIWVTGWSKSPLLIKETVSPTTKTIKEKVTFFPEKIRYKINIFLNQTLTPRQAGVYKAILTGDRSSLSPEINESFKSSGATHLLAISGIHIGLLALISTFLLNTLLKRSEKLILHFPVLKLSAALSLIPLTMYATVAGFGPPVVRSLIMATVFIAAFICNRQWSIANNISIAGLIILAFNPTLLTTASFQLSFTAVLAISLFAPLLKRITEASSSPTQKNTLSHKLTRWIIASLLISTIASAGTAPIILTHFNRISLLSPFTTLLIEPLLCIWSLTLGLFGALLLPLPQLSAFVFQAGAVGIDLAITITSTLSAIPFASIWSPAPHPIQTVSWYVLLVSLASWQYSRFQLLTKIGFVLGLTGLTIPFLISPKTDSKYMEVTVLDVGQGSAIILQLPDKRTFLVDGGQKTYSRKSEKQSFDVGEQIIAPYLWHNKITKLSGVIISHQDADHYSGLGFILDKFKPDNLWINHRNNKTPDLDKDMYSRIVDKAKKLGIAVSTPVQGENLLSGSTAKLIVISQISPKTAVSKSKSTNDESLVLRLQYNNRSFLFPSDIEKQGELSVINQSKDLIDTDVLIAPHHGSKTSSSPNFLDAVSPEIIVVSAGKNSSGIFPSEENISAYKKIGSKVYLTAESGSVFFKTDGDTLTTTTFHKR